MAQVDDVVDHGLEVLKKSAFIPDDTYPTRYGIRTSLSGNLRPSGLNVGGLITEVTLDSTSWTPLPATPLANRNAICIQNRSNIEIKINYDNTVPTYTGMVIVNNGERFYDISDGIIIYAKATSGTPTITIEELA